MDEATRNKVNELRILVREAAERRRQAIVFELARGLSRALADGRLRSGERGEEDKRTWVRIASLSQLRSCVGGRFQNLKDRWVAAGLPLREHRGDRREGASLNYEGWINLSNWVAKQGYEVRLAGEDAPYLFEVRSAAHANKGSSD